jgi:hypothetical protein
MNLYRITVSFGDGNPHKTTIEAKNGLDAHERARKAYVTARTVHVLGFVSQEQESKEASTSSLVYGCDMFPQAKKVPRPACRPLASFARGTDPLLIEVVRLRHEGVSQARIAKTLGVSRSFVRRRLKAAS